MSGPLYARGPGDYDFVPLTREESTWWGVAVPDEARPGRFRVVRHADVDAADAAATSRPWVTVDWYNPMNNKRGIGETVSLVLRRRGQARWYFAATGWEVPL